MSKVDIKVQMRPVRRFLERSLSSMSIIPLKARFTFEPDERPQPTISAPLAGLTLEELFSQIDSFVDHFGLQEDRAVLRKGALAAQNPEEFENSEVIEEIESSSQDDDYFSAKPLKDGELASRKILAKYLSADELEALRFESQHPWKSTTKDLLLSVVTCSLGAFCQGIDQSSITGAVMTFPQQMGLGATEPSQPNFSRDQWIIGLISAGPYIGAFACSVWLSDPLNHWIGRRGTLFLAALVCIVTPLGSAFTKTWPQLFICRVLLGLGIGFKEVTAPVFAAENAPTRIRGSLVSSWQIYTACGLWFGNSVNLVLSAHNIGKISWRLQLGAALLPAVPLAIFVFWCPESPRWLIKRGKIPEAWQALQRLRRHKVLAARDLYLQYVQILEERAVMGQSSMTKRFFELFYRNRLRQATLAASVVMISQQMCGINIIAFYSGTIFTRVTGDDTQGLWASWGFGACNFIFSWPAMWTIDNFGRRTLLLATFPLMCVLLLGAGLCQFIHDKATRLGLVAMFIYLYTAVYSPGEGPVPFTYSAEVFPISHREVGMAWAVFVNNLFAAVLSLTFFRIEAVMTMTGAFGFYAGLNIVALVWIYLWVPETKQLSLEELDSVFAVPTSRFMTYELKTVTPYYVRRVLHGKSTRPLPELDRVRHFEDLEPGRKPKSSVSVRSDVDDISTDS